MNKSYLAAAIVIVIALGFTGWAFSSSMTTSVSIREARTSERPVQVWGKILRSAPGVPAPFYDANLKAQRFWIEDKNHERIEVQYHGAKPEAFDTAPETSATGIVRKDAENSSRDVLVSDNLVVKCPSKYDDQPSPYRESPNGAKSRPATANAAPAGSGASQNASGTALAASSGGK